MQPVTMRDAGRMGRAPLTAVVAARARSLAPVALAFLAALTSCGDAGPPVTGPSAPASDLLERAAAADAPTTPFTVPVEVIQALASGTPRATVVTADAWRPAGETAAVPLAAPGDGATLLHAPRPDGPGAAEDVAELWMGDTRLNPFATPGDDDIVAWRHAPSRTAVAWSPVGLFLLAPEGAADVLFVWKDGAGPQPDAPPSGGAGPSLIAVGDVHHRALVRHAPDRTELDLPPSDGLTLHLVVAAPDLGWAVEAGRVVRRAGVGDGVTARVSWVDDAGERELFERHLAPGEGWISAQVDLSEVAGGGGRLVLITDPGPGGDASFDRLFWAGLRLDGPAPPVERPHLVLIDIDTLRADRLGCYGHTRDTSPGLDAWVRDTGALVFTDCIAPSSWTLPSTLSLLSGLSPAQHGVENPDRAYPESLPTLASRLADAGYDTFALTEGGYTGPAFGAGAGFDTFVVHEQHHVDWTPALEWLDERADERPTFVFLQTFAVHAPHAHDLRFEPPGAPYSGALADAILSTNRESLDPATMGAGDIAYLSRMYDAGIRRFDDDLAAFLHALDGRLAQEDVAVIITSDHGEEFGEHGRLNHGHTLFEELLRVPLIARLPDGPSGTTPAPATTLDVAPTLLELAGLTPPPSLSGRPLRHVLELDAGAERVRMAWLGSRYRALQFGDAKLVLPGGNPLVEGEGPRLYDLGADPGEQLDRAGTDAAGVADLRARLERHDERFGRLEGATDARLDDETRRTLEALGYTGDG